MPIDRKNLRILLLEARQDAEMIDHERTCLLRAGKLDPEQIIVHDMLKEPPHSSLLEGFDAVVVGGTGDYSVARDRPPFFQPLVELTRDILDRGLPMLGLCYGFHLMGAAVGGQVETRPDMGETGTFEVELTEEGRRDPILGHLAARYVGSAPPARHDGSAPPAPYDGSAPPAPYDGIAPPAPYDGSAPPPRHDGSAPPARFPAQQGHHDVVLSVPEDFLMLATSERCRWQAFRHREKPFYGLQFHPELGRDDFMRRMQQYADSYASTPEKYEAIDRQVKPTDNFDVIERWVDRVVLPATSSQEGRNPGPLSEVEAL